MPTGITINSPVVCLIVYYVRVNSYGKSRTSRRYNAGHCKGNRIAGNIVCNTAARSTINSPVICLNVYCARVNSTRLAAF
jgi:hypothetical protein